MAVRVRRDETGTALLVHRREFLGVGQEHIAAVVRRTRAWVGHLETGVIRTCDETSAARIARFLQLPADALFEQLPFPDAVVDQRLGESGEVRRVG